MGSSTGSEYCDSGGISYKASSTGKVGCRTITLLGVVWYEVWIFFVFVAFGEVLPFGLGVAEWVLVLLLTVLLVDGLSFVHSVVKPARSLNGCA